MPTKTNPIVVTEFDRRRLEGLLSVLRARSGEDVACLDDLEEELERAEVVAPADVPPHVVTMNSQVQLMDLDTQEQLELTLVFPGTADAAGGRVSVLAPAGLALLGCREREVIDWTTPHRSRRLRIERIVYQPEAARNFEL